MMCAMVRFFILHTRKCHQVYLSTWLKKKRTYLTPLNEQMSPCETEDGLQSSSGQTNQSLKTVKCDLLKDMSNVLRDIINKY
jgi:hypothetical protein